MKRTPLKRKTRLKQVSDKRKTVNKARGDFVREQLMRRYACEVHKRFKEEDWIRHPLSMLCGGFATELHEPLTRARAPGADTILDPSNSVAICRRCHTWVHDHPAEATKLGLLSGSKT
jgi:hypothetical protein